MNGFHVQAKNEIFTAASSRCRHSLKYENFTSSFGRLHQNIAPTSVPHVQHDHFSSFNQWNHWFVALSLTLPSSNLKLPNVCIAPNVLKFLFTSISQFNKSARYCLMRLLLWSSLSGLNHSIVALLTEETIVQIKLDHMKFLVFGERGKPEYPGKNLLKQSRTCMTWMKELNPDHVSGKKALTPLYQPYWLFGTIILS